MAVQFIIGRAGSGKTLACLEAVRRELSASTNRGPRLILLVPEQASFQTERALVVGHPDRRDGVGVMHRAEVLSFQRLAHRILDHAAVPAGTVLSVTARAMVLRRVIGQLSDQLVYYRRVERLAGFVDRLGETIQELIQEMVSPDDLCSGTPAAPHAKLADLALIYRAYLEYLGEQRRDPSQLLELARGHLAACAWLNGARIWVDGFAGFTRQERTLLIELAARAEQVWIALLSDPDAAARDAPPRPWDLFGRTVQTQQQLCRELIERGVEIAPPLLLRDATPPRFTHAAGLGAIERSLSGGSRAATAGSGAQAIRDFELAELPTRRAEADFAVARILDAVRESGGRLRYRDVAIIVRDLEPYGDLLSAALQDRGVPFFIDRRRAIGHHPLVEWLRSLCRMAAEELSLESVRLALKSDLLGLPRDDADELENYLLAHGIAGPLLWRQEWGFQLRRQERGAKPADSNSRINVLRRQFLDGVAEWLRTAGVPLDAEHDAGLAPSEPEAGLRDPALAAPTRLGEAWTRALRAGMSHLKIADQLESWAAQAEDEGDLDQAAEHRQVCRDVTEFLDEFESALGQAPMSVGELTAVIDAGLSQLTLALTPPMLDQVLVGAIERSRHPELKLVVLLGFNDGVFPRPAFEDTILNDDDRTALIEAGAFVTPPRRQRALEEALLAYIACTRASQRLIITYAAADASGRALRPSPAIQSLRAALPDLAVARVGEPLRQRETWPIHSTHDLATALAAEYRHRPDPAGPAADLDPLVSADAQRGTWNALYERVRQDDAWRRKLQRALAALDPPRSERISPQSVASLFPGTLTTSISRLESFAACPFKHFAQFALKLQERELAELEPVDVGKVHHAILEDFIERVVARGQPLHELADGDVTAALDASCERIKLNLPASGAWQQAREAHILQRSPAELRRVIDAQRHVWRAGRFRPQRTELPFGAPDGKGLPPLEIDTPAGRRILLRGVIDRVDLAELADEALGVVIDYKRTLDKRLNLAAVYHGLSLQLVAYLVALEQHGAAIAGRPIRPVGAFYVSIHPRYARVDHPDDFQPEQALAKGGNRPRGLLSADDIGALDTGFTGEGSSSIYTFSRNRNGAIGRIDASDGASVADFRGILAGVRRKLGELADDILHGNVRVAPYRWRKTSPCTTCPFQAVCRFEYGQEGMRFLEDLTRSEVFAKLTVRGAEA